MVQLRRGFFMRAFKIDQAFVFAVLLLGLAACGGDDLPISTTDAGVDDAQMDAAVADDAAEHDAYVVDTFVDPPCSGPPGLYVEGSCTRLADGVRAYAPQYTLWADGSGKERYLYLPEGTTIDTTDPDAWIFPVGTVFWKTFAVGELKIETRILTKLTDEAGPGGWSMRVYAWNEAQDAVTEVVDGVSDALGTTHDIPSHSMCERCHQGAADVGLGVSAIQLNHSGTGVTLSTLQSESRVSHPISLTSAVVPGDATAQAALGYLHANCGHCHGGEAPPGGFVMRLSVGAANVEDTGTYTTGVGVASGWAHEGVTARIATADPDASAVAVRMGIRGDGQMPAIGTEEVDSEGLAAVRAWISSLH